MKILLALFALLGGSAPPPGAPIPRDPVLLAGKLETTERDLSGTIELWQESGSSRVPREVTLDSLYEQRILILLSERPALSRAVLRRLAPSASRQLRSELLAKRRG